VNKGLDPTPRGKTVAAVAPVSNAANRQNMILLIQLRWIAVVGQVLTIAAVQFGLGIPLPLGPLSAVLAALVALNFACFIWLRDRTEVSSGALLLILILDMAALTTQLWSTGGVTNPFTSLYLLQVTLGAVLLEAWSSWVLVALTFGCVIGLTRFHRPLALAGHELGDVLSLQIAGMLICFALDATLLVTFITRITRNLRQRDARLAELKQQAAEEDHIVRMGLLATGAAHELGTPLASLAVILGDWRRMPVIAADADMAQEAEEMQAAILRCKAIVTGILLSAGEARGESPVVTTVNQFLDGIAREWRGTRPVKAFSYRNGFGKDLPIISDAALKQVLYNVLDNAYEASPTWVGFAVEREDDTLIAMISDAGSGFAPEMLAQFGKPYQSSKKRLGGGLGLFLVVNVVRKFGGFVDARNRLAGGAIVTLKLPLAAVMIEEHGSAD
jgi:two-component system, sensor histidine kinase RegB